MGSMFENTRAFAPFYADPVAVEGVRENGRKVSGTFKACVSDMGLDDLLLDDSTGTARRKICVSFLLGGDSWPLDGTLPQIGDKIWTEDGAKWSVKSVKRAMGAYDCEAVYDAS